MLERFLRGRAAVLVGAALASVAAGPTGRALRGKPQAFCRDADRQRADEAIAALRKLADARDTTLPEIQKAWRRLDEEPCLEYVVGPDLDSVAAFRDWWRSGGERWLIQSVVPNTELWVAPDARATLAADFVSESLKGWSGPELEKVPPRLFCPRADVPCDPEALAWVKEMELALEPRPHSTSTLGALSEPGVCRNVVGRLPPLQRYRGFVECVTRDATLESPRFPAGSFRAPDGGWLVLRGIPGVIFRGETMGVFDLETGAAFLIGAGRGTSTVMRVGRVPGSLVRQTLFVTAFARYIRPGHVRLRRYRVPSEIELVWWKDDDFQLQLPGAHISLIAGATDLDWDWMQGATTVASGRVSLPAKGSDFQTYFQQRVELLVQTLVEGCVPRKPPDRVTVTPAHASTDPEVERQLQAAWKSALARPLCRR